MFDIIGQLGLIFLLVLKIKEKLFLLLKTESIIKLALDNECRLNTLALY